MYGQIWLKLIRGQCDRIKLPIVNFLSEKIPLKSLNIEQSIMIINCKLGSGPNVFNDLFWKLHEFEEIACMIKKKTK